MTSKRSKLQKDDADKRIALKLEAENDPSNSEVEDSAMNSLAELWHREDDPDSEVDLLIFQQRDRYVASMHETGGEKPVCEEPRHFSHAVSAVGITLTTRVASCSTTHLSRRQGLEKISVIRELGVWEVVDRPATRLCLVRVGLTSTKMTKTNRSTAVDWSCKRTKRQAKGSFFSASPPLEALRSLLICATIDELRNELGQLFAWTELVVLMLTNVRRAHFYSPARRKVFVELLEEAGTDKSNVGRLLRSMYGCRDAGVNWEFAICQVMIALGFVQARASPCIYRQSSSGNRSA